MTQQSILATAACLLIAAAFFGVVMVIGYRQRRKEAEASGIPLQPLIQKPPSTPKPKPQRVGLKQLAVMPTPEAYARMLKEIRSWGISLIFFGVIHVIQAGLLNSQWGLVLIVVGGMSFIFKDASMFAVYGVTLAWAALSNLTSGAGGWALFSLLQIFFAFQTFRQFFIFRRVQSEYSVAGIDPLVSPAIDANDEALRMIVASAESESGMPPAADDPFAAPASPPPSRAHRFFPWMGVVSGILAVFGTVGFFTGILISGLAGAEDTTGVALLGNIALSLSIFGVAVGLAATLSKFRPMVASAFGAVVSGLSLLIWIGLIVLSIFS